MNEQNWCSKYAPSIDNQDEGIWPIWMGPTLGVRMMTKLCRWNNLIQLKHKLNSEQDGWCKLERKHLNGFFFISSNLWTLQCYNLQFWRYVILGKKLELLFFVIFTNKQKLWVGFKIIAFRACRFVFMLSTSWGIPRVSKGGLG